MPEEKKLKVCHFASVHSIHDTRVFHRECVSLAKIYNVTLIAIGVESGINQGVNVIAIRKPQNRIQRIFKTRRMAYQLALNEHADIYHFHDPELIPLALWLTLKGKKVIYDIHENVTESMKMKRWLPLKFLFIPFYLCFDALAAKFFTLILAEHAYVPIYKKRYPTKEVFLVENFAPIKLLEPFQNLKRSAAEKNIFYIGSFNEEYCFMQTLETIYLLTQKGWKGKLYIIGYISPDDWAAINQLSYFQHIRAQLVFTGYLRLKDGYEFSINCAIGFSFVSPNINVRDSVPRKLYEYMAIGLPVVSSNFPTYETLVNEMQVGICVNSENPEEMANKAWELLNQPEPLNEFARNGLKAATDYYNWENEEKSLFEVYSKMTKQQ
jgi:glycosyltransferase involved in cell wall biosynthesis